MTRVTGADGCRGGWIAVTWEADGKVSLSVYATFAALLDATSDSAVIAVDIPIGLPDAAEPGGRACDREARARLGAGRGSCVFAPPVRGVLAAADYPEALRINRASSPAALGLSKQCWNIVAKIREADAALSPAMQARVAEVHPEVSFVALAGRDSLPPKKSDEGQRLRMRLLRAAGFPVAKLLGAAPRAVALPDDVLDACAAAWSARRIAQGEAWVLPSEVTPPGDSRGLEMSIRA